MNIQMRYTAIEDRQTRQTIQARLREAEAQRLAALVKEPAEPPRALHRDLAHAVRQLEHQAWLVVSEFALEVGDVLHGHRPHRHHHAH